MSPSTEVRENRRFASEIKFIVEPSCAQQIRNWVRGRVDPDPNARGEMGDTYQVTSIYFDTVDFDVLRRRGSFGRGKYRARRYDLGDVIFLERKLKQRRLVSKRRSIVSAGELVRLEGSEAEPGWAGFWFHRRLLARRLHPVCQISYHRTARASMTNQGPIRLTLDEDVRALPRDSVAFDHSAAGLPISPEHCILELKFIRDVPAVFKHLMEEFALVPRPVSKYRLAGAALGFDSESGIQQPVEEVAELVYA
jgi:hypothetical protein